MELDPNCLFCKIIRKEIPAKEVERDEFIVAFHDVNPQAPTHILVVPTIHVEHLSDFVNRADGDRAIRLLRAASEIGRRFGPNGYRVVMNEGREAGQTVFHLHTHVLAGRPMHWPPG
jgi:histidine triad (HIT) family protein